MKETLTHIAWALGLLALAYWFYGSFLTRLRNRIREHEARIRSWRNQRFDLLLPLTQTVERYMGHESRLLREISALRSQKTGGGLQGGRRQDAGFGNMIRNLVVAVEAYPNLRASENVTSLMDSMSRLQDHIGEAEREYCAQVRIYNDFQLWPFSILARAAGHGIHPYFTQAGLEAAPAKIRQLPSHAHWRVDRRSRRNKGRFSSRRRPRWVASILMGLMTFVTVLGARAQQVGNQAIRPGLYSPGSVQAADGQVLAVFTNRNGKIERWYPLGATAAPVLGFRGSDLAGAAGIELAVDRMLGWNPIPRATNQVQCRTILTLRLDCQRIVEEAIQWAGIAHRAKSVTALVIEPQSGRILAMGNWPAFDANKSRLTPPDLWRNRIIGDVHEPGAALRFVVLAAALDGGISLQTNIDCGNGRLGFEGTVVHESTPLGFLPMDEVVVRPSIIGLAKMGLSLGAERLHASLTNFGFGVLTGIPAPGESRGILSSAQKWNRVTTSRVPMGYAIAATQLQMAMAMGAVANHGIYVSPVLIDRIETDSGQVVWAGKRHRRRLVSNEVATETARVLERVASPSGNGSKAAIPGVRVAVCPGAVLIAGAHGYRAGAYFAQCTGFCPADEPAICVAVALEEPAVGEGDKVAEFTAPVFQRVAQRTLEAIGRNSP